MKKVNLLIGLPGSGKTTWLVTNAKNNCILDDISQTDTKLERLSFLLNTENELWISDVCFCDKDILLKAIDKLKELSCETIEFHFVLFKQSREECLNNVVERDDGRFVNNSIELFSKKIEDTFIFIEYNFNNVVSYKIKKNKNKMS